MVKALRLLLILTLASTALLAQEAGTSGTVKTATGDPLPGVTVLLKGTSVGTTTDVNGSFRLAEREGVLVFSFIGYSTTEVPIGAQSVINVTLEEDTKTLSEVVVVGFGVQQRKDVTGAIAVVGAKEFVDRPNSQFGNLLEGKTAGVQVVTGSGKPSQGFSLRIRGTNSISSSSEPLYVVDGTVIEDTRNVNPADIETLTILKDASAAAIYGSQGANGVVLITTKKGKAGAMKVEVSAYGGFSEVWKTKKVLNAEQYRDLMTELGQNTDWTQFTQNTDWQKQIFRRGHQQNYQGSISGKVNNTSYYISGGWTENNGAVRSSTMNRYSLKTSIETKVSELVTIGTNINYLHYHDVDVTDNLNVNSGGVILGVLTTPPNIGIFKPNGQYTSNPFQEWENPVASTDGPKRGYNNQRVFGNVYVEVQVLKDLKFRSNAGIDYTTGVYDYFLDPVRTSYGRSNNGLATNTTNFRNYYIIDNTLTYTKVLNQHSFSALAGTVVQKSKNEDATISTKGFSSSAITTTGAGSTITAANNTKEERANTSFISRITYDYAGKYLLTANYRVDGSSVFGPDKKYGHFPSVSVGWRLSDESFIKPLVANSDIKLRAGWGLVGNDRLPTPYGYQGLVGSGANYPTGGVIRPGTYPISISNYGLHWEQTAQYNFGLDAAFLNGRLTVTVDYYNKTTTGLLLNIPIPKATGFDNANVNAGKIQNKGWEFQVSSQNLTGPLKWQTDFNITFNRNKVINVLGQKFIGGAVSNRDNVSYTQEGHPIGMFYGYVYGGVDPATGAAYYAGADGTGTTTPNPDTDKKFIGNPNPKFYAGMTNTLSWMNLSLSIFLQGSYGNDIYNGTRIEIEGMNDAKNQSIAVLNRWRKPGDITNIPKATWGSTDNSRTSSRFVENGSYLRAKAITLAYMLPTSLISKAKLTKAKFYVTGENLFTITKYSGFDPEVNYAGASNSVLGIDFGTYPQTRNIIFGANLTF